MRGASPVSGRHSFVLWLRRTVGGFVSAVIIHTNVSLLPQALVAQASSCTCATGALNTSTPCALNARCKGKEREEVAKKPHAAGTRGTARGGRPDGVPGRGGHEPAQHEHTQQHRKVD